MRRRFIGVVLAVLLVLSAGICIGAVSAAGEVNSGEPPQYLYHKMDPYLVWKLNQKIGRWQGEAQGKLPSEIDAELGQRAPPNPGLPSTGTPRVPVIIIAFSDAPLGPGQGVTDIQAKFFGTGGPGSTFPYESVQAYYQRASYNQLTIQGDVLPVYTAANPRTHYYNMDPDKLDANGNIIWKTGAGWDALAEEALTYYATSYTDASHPNHWDFWQYDGDTNGVMDGLYVIWLGPYSQYWAGFWWDFGTGHNGPWTIHPADATHPLPLVLNKYVWQGYGNGLFNPQSDLHETGHLLGLPDYYSYDVTGQTLFNGVGGIDMMHGAWGDHNCFSKFLLDWITPTIISSTSSQTITLNPSGTSRDAVLIMPGATGSSWAEFFMAQYRLRGTGNDPAVGGIATPYPADGMLIWHVDARTSGNNFIYNQHTTAHKFITPEQADGLGELDMSTPHSANAGDFYNPGNAFGTITNPNSNNYAGAATKVWIDQITQGSGTMSARFSIGDMTALSQPAATPASPYIDEDFTISGALSKVDDGSALTGQTVKLQEWDTATPAWVDVAGKTATTQAPGGTYAIILSEPSAGTVRYRAVFDGSGALIGSTSPELPVVVQKIPTTLSALTADPASPFALHDFSLGGTMTSTVTGPVAGEIVSLQEYDGASWTDTGVPAVTGSDGAFFFITKEDAAGVHTYRAHYPEGSRYLGSEGADSPVTVQKIPTLLITPVPSSATPLINTPFTLAGTLTAEGAGLAGKTVNLWTSTDSGVTWTDTMQTAPTLDADGHYTFTITETVAGYRSYRVTFGPDPAYADSASDPVTVRINRAPDVSLAQASVAWLWSPHHDLIMESVVGVIDPDGDPVTITIPAITSDEATATAKGAGGAKYAPDAFISGGNSAQVRSERSGESDGRVYALNFVADDGFGGVTPGFVLVKVPLDKKTPCVDSGQAYVATVVK